MWSTTTRCRAKTSNGGEEARARENDLRYRLLLAHRMMMRSRVAASVLRALILPAAPRTPLLLQHTMLARCALRDLDVNLHVNNASALSIMEMARWDWLAKSGLLRVAVKDRLVFMLGSQAVRYRREIGAFQQFQIDTKIVAMDQAWIWVKAMISTKGENTSAFTVPCVTALHRVIIKSARTKQTIVPKDFFFSAASTTPLPPPPSEVSEVVAFLEWDKQIKSQQGG
jgi:acyl-CoA thioesterase FadM